VNDVKRVVFTRDHDPILWLSRLAGAVIDV
jgi:hypothetical protein